MSSELWFGAAMVLRLTRVVGPTLCILQTLPRWQEMPPDCLGKRR